MSTDAKYIETHFDPAGVIYPLAYPFFWTYIIKSVPAQKVSLICDSLKNISYNMLHKLPLDLLAGNRFPNKTQFRPTSFQMGEYTYLVRLFCYTYKIHTWPAHCTIHVFSFFLSLSVSGALLWTPSKSCLLK